MRNRRFFRPLQERAVMADFPEQIQLKTFTVVTVPKSRMSTNSTTPAYLIFQITHRAGNEKTFTKEPFRHRFNSPPFLLGEGIRGGAYRLIRVYKKQEFLFLT